MIYSFLLHNMSIGPLYRNPDTENDTVLSVNLIFVIPQLSKTNECFRKQTSNCLKLSTIFLLIYFMCKYTK